MAMKWYGIHVQSGTEKKVRLTLLEKFKNAGMEELLGEVLLPTETVVELKHGEKKTSTRNFFPGYMFINMEMTNDSWHLVKETPKVTGFMGGTNPSPISDAEVAKIAKRIEDGASKPVPKILFEVGETVRVIEGPFLGFSGVVEDVKPDKGKLTAMVSIFGRATKVELEFSQAEKMV